LHIYGEEEDELPSTSHARCRQCGQARHKIARFNICQSCWEQTKPSIRQYWRQIKERRALRRAVEAHVREQQEARKQLYIQEEFAVPTEVMAEAAAPVNGHATLAELYEAIRTKQLPKGQELAAIARIRAEGVPPFGTQERGLYLQLFRGLPPDAEQDALVERLYVDTDVPVHEIQRALGIDGNETNRIRKRRGYPTRDAIQHWNPRGRMFDDESLVIRDGEAYFDSPDGTSRRVWPGGWTEPEPIVELEPAAPEPEPAAEEPVVETPSGRRRPPPSPQTIHEVLRLYEDMSVPVKEIEQAYSLSTSQLYRILEINGIAPRNQRGPRPSALNVDQTGRFEMVNGKQTWVPGGNSMTTQLHLGQAPGAQLAVPEPQPLPAPAVSIHEREWAVSFIVTRTSLVSAPTIDEALRKVREKHGADIEIVSTQRT